jgi:exodeoxyribonuclease III
MAHLPLRSNNSVLTVLKRPVSGTKKPEKSTKVGSTQTLLFPTFRAAAGSGTFPRPSIRIASWNINGLRANLQRADFLSFTSRENLDVLCLNETKIQDCHVSAMKAHFPAFPYYCFSCSRTKLGYSGVAVLSKTEPISWTEGLDCHPAEGRVITAEFDSFFLLCTYVPNSGRDRFQYRIEKWDRDLRRHIKNLEDRGKSVVWVGDMNVISEEIDIYRLKGNEKFAGATPEERKSYKETLGMGLVDTFRHLYPNERKYSWFSTVVKTAREKNEGWRIDAAVVSQSILGRVQDSLIHADVMGSDHHPIELVLSNSN